MTSKMAAAQGCCSPKSGTEPSSGFSDECCEYGYRIGKIIGTEFSHLKGVAYLDHAATTLYAQSQLQDVFRSLATNLYGNPHSRSTSSQLSTDLVDQVRYRVTQYFNTTTDEYSVIFTSGATGALKLLADTFAWNPKETDNGSMKVDLQNGDHYPDHFLYLEDNHTSVLGIRAIASHEGATVSCISVEEATKFLSVNSEVTTGLTTNFIVEDTNGVPARNCLFAFPAQSNFCGRKYPLTWINAVRSGYLTKFLPLQRFGGLTRWSVVLDAAGTLGTSSLDLHVWQPEFVCISFHKLFGFPTGLGALLVHRSAHSLLRARYFGGGTVAVAIARENFHVFRPSLEEKFEAGTVSFLDILSVQHGFDCLQRIAGMPVAITQYTFQLARYVHHHLSNCYHRNGQPVAELYCQTDFQDASTQGAIVNFNLLWSDGQYIGFAEVEKIAAVYDIHLRTGCMCNPGACQRYLQLTFDDLKSHFEAGHVCGDDMDLIDGRPTGSIRVSFGYMSTPEDAQRLISMIDSCFRDKSSSCCHTCISNAAPNENNSWTKNGKGGGLGTWAHLASRQEPEQEEATIQDKTVRKIARSSLSKDVVSPIEMPAMASKPSSSKSPEVKHKTYASENGYDAVNMALDVTSTLQEKFLPKLVDVATKTDRLLISQPVKMPLVEQREALAIDPTHPCKCLDYSLEKCVGSHICAISVFPIKSCSAFQVKRWPLSSRGLLYDREWMIVSKDFVSLTQKRIPRMCLIKPEINLSNKNLSLHFKGMPSVNIPLHMDANEMGNSATTLFQTKVCRDRVEGIDCGDEVADWLSHVLEIEGCRLLMQSQLVARKSSKKWNTEIGAPSATVLSLTNVAQYLLLNMESGRALSHEIMSGCEGKQARQDVTVSLDCEDRIDVDKLIARFRGNLIVDGIPSFAEERWQKVLIGSCKFNVDGPCNRCQMICIDQDTGEKNREPLLTLTSTRGKKVNFGLYLSRTPQSTDNHMDNSSIIQVGDPVIAKEH